MWTFDYVRENFIHPADQWVWVKMCEVDYDGQRLGGVTMEMKTPSPNETELSQKHSELRALLECMIRAGYDVRRVMSQERPDFLVEFGDGTHAFVEVAESTGSASSRYFSTIFRLQRDLRDAIAADVSATQAIQGRIVTFSMPDVPKANRRNIALSEMRSFLVNEDLTKDILLRSLQQSSYPELAALGVMVSIHIGPNSLAMVTSSAHAFNPDDSVVDTDSIVRDKCAKAATYLGAPLWLVVALTDLMSLPTESLRRFRQNPTAFAPFSRMLVMADREVLDLP